jgi:hypothetical protein
MFIVTIADENPSSVGAQCRHFAPTGLGHYGVWVL